MLTLIEAAARLGVTAATLRQQIHNGSLKARKVGRDWTVSEREVERYRRDHRKGGVHNPIVIGVDDCPLGDGCPVCNPA